MSNYVICTDSSCDISDELLAEWGVPYRHLTFRFNGENDEYTGLTMQVRDFYNRMRDGGVAKTAAVNVEAFSSMFEEILAEGKDVLYLGFSSGLSTTYNSGRLAAMSLAEKYPERKIRTVDTLCASAGEGLLVYLALREQKKGRLLDEVADYVEKVKMRVCHWFTVDDLVYLKRGGRVSPTTAAVGNILQFKPILHVDNEGRLVKVGVARGRRKSLETVAEKFGALSIEAPEEATVFISHGDCREDAELVAKIIRDKYKANVQIITHVGAVIGAHSGPGTIALFFLGKER